MRWLVTGGAGFIGSAFVRAAFSNGWAERVCVVDALTYAGNLENLDPIRGHAGYRFVRCDICDAPRIRAVLAECRPEALFHFAAESHVDRSIDCASKFVRTNVLGTQVLLDESRTAGVERFVQISTDEVYGTLPLEGSERFVESTPLNPTSPYAASKAAADHLVQAAHRTHGMDTIITRCSNNYGPYQFPEKFIPLFITNAQEGKPLPLYGDGANVRDWIHVDDHVVGIRLAFERGRSGSVYNLGGDCERSNRDIAHLILRLTAADAGLLRRVADRPAHDRRYAIDATKARSELGFHPRGPIEERLRELVLWYQENRGWWQRIKAGEYREYYERLYADRLLINPGTAVANADGRRLGE